jgi:hypothetical protein
MRSGCSLPSLFSALRVFLGLVLAAVLCAALAAEEDPPLVNPPAPPNPLVWDATDKFIDPQLGDGAADFSFTVTNSGDKPVTIEQIRPTCGCTVTEMPSNPWLLAPHETGTFTGTIDFRGKEGTISRAIFVNSTAGTQALRITVRIPQMDPAMRLKARELAEKNRQAVFSGDCVKCHLAPIKDKTGNELFTAACAVCHLSHDRASFVPDLLVARQHRDAEFWRKWISEGKAGTLMPAWSRKNGGPLTDEQIDSLVKFALETLPTEPPAKE